MDVWTAGAELYALASRRSILFHNINIKMAPTTDRRDAESGDGMGPSA